MNDEAQFEAFLRGDDELARALQAMPQAEPSPELDAVIMQRVQLEHAQRSREAANDAHTEIEPALSVGTGTRWRLPVGIAASVLVGVLATQMMESDRVRREAVLAPAAEVALVEEARAPSMEAMTPPPPPPPETTVASRPAAPRAVSVVEAKKMDRQEAPPPAAPQVQLAEAAAPGAPAAPAPAPVVASAAPEQALGRAAERSAAPAMQKVEVAGSSIRRAETGGAAAWLGRIDALLIEGKKAEALAEWEKFRAAHPDHAVPDALQAKIKALLP